jgi:rare lipoprotein A (peptidoglycan hydrolase)
MWLAALFGAAFSCMASMYGTEHGQSRTATGEVYTGRDRTCALRSKPHNENYMVEYHGRRVTCRHNDWGPALWTHRCIDLSRATAHVLRLPGVGRVLIRRKK